MHHWGLPAAEARKRLPIWEHKEQFMRLLDRADVQFILLEAETGSGKTTQIPQWCVEWLQRSQPNNQQIVCCTQPRRLATFSVARRVAQEMDIELGQEVGFSVRFEEVVSPKTVLKYCTDGVLLAEATHNNRLGQYGVIILDEVHERSLTMDVLMGLVKAIAAARPELRVVVMSATLEAGNFRNYFNQRSAELKLPGRTHPVTTFHTDWITSTMGGWTDSESICKPAVAKVKELHEHERRTPGDILLFLPGEEEIDMACEELNQHQFGPGIGELRCLPLYSALPYDQQQLIFERMPSTPRGGPINRRCIVATNIAETSMTIEGVVFVVDPGFCKRKQFDPITRIESLLIQPISQASAVQRTGRAGRTRPGKCFRLYSEDDFKKMKPVDPEIRHSNLANVILRMKKCGVQNLNTFDFMDAPPAELLAQAITLLIHLEAIDAGGKLTSLGSKMADLPVDPPLARMLIESIKLQCSREVIAIAAMLSTQNCFFRPRRNCTVADAVKASKFTHPQGDHLSLLRVFNAFTKTPKYARIEFCHDNFLNYRALQFAADISTQLQYVMKYRLKVKCNSAAPVPTDTNVIKALVAGFFTKIAFLKHPNHENGAGRSSRYCYYITVEGMFADCEALQAFDDAVEEALVAGRKPPKKSSMKQKMTEYQIHPASVLFKPKGGVNTDCVLYEQAVQLKGGKYFLRNVTAIRPEWLLELAPQYFNNLRKMINPELAQLLPSTTANGNDDCSGWDQAMSNDNW